MLHFEAADMETERWPAGGGGAAKEQKHKEASVLKIKILLYKYKCSNQTITCPDTQSWSQCFRGLLLHSFRFPVLPGFKREALVCE